MSTLQIQLDPDTSDALEGRYRWKSVAEGKQMMEAGLLNERPPGPDPLDAIVGSISSAPVDDIDEVVYGR